MANEFKIRKGLIVEGASSGTVVNVLGSQGQLFSVTDDLSGSIFAVSDISGVPIFDVNSSGLSTFDGLVSGITPVNAANFVTKAYADGLTPGAGVFLPLIGGTMTGDTFHGDNVISYYGSSNDFLILHDGSNAYLKNTVSGNLYLRQDVDDADIIFQCDDGSGGVATYLSLDGSAGNIKASKDIRFLDGVQAQFGTGADLKIYHDGTNNYIETGGTGSGDIVISQSIDDKDIIFKSDNGSGGVTEYFRLDGSTEQNVVSKNMRFEDNIQAQFGAGTDLRIYHDGSNSYINEAGTGDLIITGGNDILFNDPNGLVYMNMNQSNSVELYYGGTKKLETAIVGVGTATTAGGTLIDGWITTTQLDPVDNDTIATTAYVNNKIQLIPAGLAFEGTWDARTVAEGGAGTPPSASPLNGQFWIVSIDGSQNLSGITDWKVGDWAIYVDNGAGTDGWQKVDNSSVLDGFGTGGSVAGWAGSGTSNTLTNSPITFSGNDINTPGDLVVNGTLYVSEYIQHLGNTSNNIRFTTDAIAISANATFAGTGTFTTATNRILTLNASSTTGGFTYMSFKQNGTETFRIFGNHTDDYLSFFNQTLVQHQLTLAADGNVGIGTTSPTSKLDIQQTTAGNIISAEFDNLDYTAGNRNAIKIRQQISASGSYSAFLGSHKDTGNFFLSNDSITADHLVIDPSGNVGIGTDDPDDKLEVNGGNIRITHNSPILRFIDTDVTDLQHRVLGGGNAGLEYSADVNNVASGYHRWDISNSEKMRLIESGNLGIGATGPNANLQVERNTSTANLFDFYDIVANIGNLNSNPGNHYSSGIRIYQGSGTMGSGLAALNIGVSTNSAIPASRNTATLETPNGMTGGLKFNTRDSSATIRFFTDSAERMVISSAGLMKFTNYGAGTLVTDASGNITAAPAGPGNVGYLPLSAGSGYPLTGNLFINNGFTLSWGADTTKIAGNSSTNALSLITASTTRIRITSTGNVGIGTTSPSARLVVSDAGATGLEIFPNDAGNLVNIMAYDRLDSAYREINLDGSNYNFEISNSTKMVIDTSGNVGIGTTSPAAKLDISNVTGGTYALEISTPERNRALFFYNSASTTDAGYLGIKRGSVDALNHRLATTGNSAVCIGEGNFGIGTDSPDAKLDVESTVDYQIMAKYNATNYASYGYYGLDVIGGGNPYIFKLQGTERMRIFSNGNVNIGVAETGSSAVTGPFVVTHSSSRFLTSSFEEGTVSLSAKNNNNNLESLRLAGDSIKFFNGTNTVGSQKMVILSSGNVGIGTTSPNYKLTVSGGINAGGVVTYTKAAGSLDTTGYAIAGLGTAFNGSSAGFTFTAYGGTGQYQKVVYSCHGSGTNWVVDKVIDEGTNVFDIAASAASAATIVFTFKTRSGSQGYSPRVVIEATGHSIISTYA